MNRHSTIAALVVLTLAVLAPAFAGDTAGEPEVVVVQHILIGFKRSVPGKKIDRTKREADELAHSLLERARGGEDFDGLVKQYTDDQYPGILTVTNRDAPRRNNARTRDQVVPGFGDAAFGLELGAIGIVEYRGGRSPYGWHIIKRLE